MKKILSVFLCALMLLSMAVPVSAADEELKVIVANDLHYNPQYSYAGALVKKNSISEDYFHIASTGRLLNESYAIIKAFLEQAAASDSEFVLLPGDLVDNGTKEEHAAFAQILKSFEETSGKSVFVAPGNHDLLKTSVSEFIGFYQELGYSEALAVDTLSASYTADLDNGYRLLSIDSCIPGEGGHGINAERLEWIKAQCQKAKEDGKKLVAIMHHNLLDHYNLSSIVHAGASVNADIGLADVLAEGGVKYIFTGHTHNHDIQSYTAKDGTVIYDVVTGSLNVWPCEYREVSFGSDVRLKVKAIEKIDTSILASGYSERAADLVANNFPQYARECVEVGMRITFLDYTKASRLKSLLKLDAENDAQVVAVIDKVAPKLVEALSMPLYAENEAEEGKSIESIVAQYGKTLPESDYKDIYDLAVGVYLEFVGGDEYLPSFATETILVTRGFAAVLSYTLSEVSGEEYAQVLDFLLDKFGVDVSVDLLNYAGSELKRFEGAELLLTTALNPIITGFTVDGAPADRNVTLPGYSELVEEEPTFWDKLISFFLKISEFFRSLIAFRF